MDLTRSSYLLTMVHCGTQTGNLVTPRRVFSQTRDFSQLVSRERKREASVSTGTSNKPTNKRYFLMFFMRLDHQTEGHRRRNVAYVCNSGNVVRL